MTGFPGVFLGDGGKTLDGLLAAFRRMAVVVNRINSGKINVKTEFTLATGTTTTVVTDDRLSLDSVVLLDPTTANAAAEVPYAISSDRRNGQWTFTHVNSGTSDRTYKIAILG